MLITTSRLAVIVLLISCCQNSSADALDQYLFSSFEDLQMNIRSAVSAPPNEPWLSDPEIRVSPERDAFDRTSQTYRFRFRPTGRSERRAIRSLSLIENRLADANWDASLSDVLATRYLRAIDLAGQEVELALATQRLSLDRSVLVSTQMLSATREFDAGRLQNAALQLELRQEDVKRAERRAVGLRAATVGDWLVVPPSVQPSVSARLIHPEMVSSWLDQIAEASSAKSHDAEVARLELVRAQQRAALEKSRRGIRLDLIEMGYEAKTTDSYNVTLGFRLPFGQGRNSLYRNVREIAGARQQLWLAEHVAAEDIGLAIGDLRLQIESYSATIESVEQLGAQIRTTATDSDVVSTWRKHELDLLESAAALHIDVLRDFIRLLHTTGMLHARPRRNWIERSTS